jgi:hypothetical protein
MVSIQVHPLRRVSEAFEGAFERREPAMRFMVLATSQESVPPTAAAVWRYNEELVRAGVLLAADGPASSARGARVRFSGGRASYEEGAAPAVGYWLIDVASRREALDWVRRCPYEGEVEIHRVIEPGDVAALNPEQEDYLVAHR